ncbi:MAG: hypothetical protein COA78_30500 [Blastopirellula sp.]|nr:MAG: hypothetical protein COA78_30500 [Blastopirellula sp.]
MFHRCVPLFQIEKISQYISEKNQKLASAHIVTVLTVFRIGKRFVANFYLGVEKLRKTMKSLREDALSIKMSFERDS